MAVYNRFMSGYHRFMPGYNSLVVTRTNM